MRQIRISLLAEKDIETILEWTHEHFGEWSRSAVCFTTAWILNVIYRTSTEWKRPRNPPQTDGLGAVRQTQSDRPLVLASRVTTASAPRHALAIALRQSDNR